MRRIELASLNTWYLSSKRKPLLLRGARQVGKSTLVRNFAKEYKLDLVEINLERQRLRQTRKEDLDLNLVIQELLQVAQKRLSDKTLFFFDEIQEDPQLLKWLRYFYEDRPELAVIAAGSLLEIALEKENFSFPVGRVSFQFLEPMSFREFLWARDKSLLEEAIFQDLNFSEAVHKLASAQLRDFLFVGGMPEAVSTFIGSGHLDEVRDVHGDIFQSYMADFPKYGKRVNIDRIQRIFRQSPAQVGKKVKLSAFDSLSPAKEVRKTIERLKDAKILRPVFHAECGGVPLKATVDYSVSKLYFLDVGLMNYGLGVDFQMLDQNFESLFVSKGMIAEQFVAQHLGLLENSSSSGELFYWLRDKGTQKGEIDFVIQKEGHIFPLEVKADQGGRLKSLFYFAAEKKWHKAIKLSLLPYSVKKHTHKIHLDGKTQGIQIEVMNVPLYAVEALPKLLEKF